VKADENEFYWSLDSRLDKNELQVLYSVFRSGVVEVLMQQPA